MQCAIPKPNQIEPLEKTYMRQSQRSGLFPLLLSPSSIPFQNRCFCPSFPLLGSLVPHSRPTGSVTPRFQSLQALVGFPLTPQTPNITPIIFNIVVSTTLSPLSGCEHDLHNPILYRTLMSHSSFRHQLPILSPFLLIHRRESVISRHPWIKASTGPPSPLPVFVSTMWHQR